MMTYGMNRYGTAVLVGSSPESTYTEPLTVAQVEQALALPVYALPDTLRDAELEAMIAAARDVAEVHQKRDLVRKEWEFYFDYFPCMPIPLRTQLVSVEEFTYRDSDGTFHEMVQGTDYIVDTVKRPGIVLPPYGEWWPSFTPWPTSAVMIRFLSGYSSSDPYWSAAGAQVKKGMLMLISHWYNQGPRPFEIAPGEIQEYPFAVTSLLSTGVTPGVG